MMLSTSSKSLKNFNHWTNLNPTKFSVVCVSNVPDRQPRRRQLYEPPSRKRFTSKASFASTNSQHHRWGTTKTVSAIFLLALGGGFVYRRSYSQNTHTMSKLTPAKPEEVMVIRNLTPDLVTLSVPFSRFGLARVGGRATIIRLKSQDLVVFSPVALTPDVKSTIESLGGKVKFLVAPDIEHHIFLSAWKQAYPDAQIIAPDGLKEKREQNPETRGLKFAHILTPTNKHGYKIPEFGDEMEIEYVDAHPNQEIVLFHKPTKTMVEADFIFNLPATEQFSKSEESPTQGLVTKLFVALMSAKGSVTWQKRTIWYLFASKDRKGYAQSANSMAKWDFDRIIPCHGDVIETGGKETFTNLLEWFLDGDKKRV